MMCMTTKEAGRYLGGRNHSTVLHGISIVTLVRQKYGTEKERTLLQSWDRYTEKLLQQREEQEEQHQKDSKEMDINTLRYRGRINEQTWIYGQNITVIDNVITINGRNIYPQTFGMFTGLYGRDKKNPTKKHEIYDGDIVSRKGISGNYVVRYNDRHAAFRLIPTIEGGPRDGKPAYMNASEQYIIHGNIHDDPVMGTAYRDAYFELQDLQELQREQP